MAIIIRVLYNNENWQAPCRNPGGDRGCWSCFKPNVNIRPPSLNDDVCNGSCWEQHLCTEYKWGCTPQGNIFGKRAYPGILVFFVFKQPDGKYTLWGKTVARSIDDNIVRQGKDYEEGFSFIHFNSFEPLPRTKWIKNLTAVAIVGKSWGRGRYRYIDAAKEASLLQMI